MVTLEFDVRLALVDLLKVLTRYFEAKTREVETFLKDDGQGAERGGSREAQNSGDQDA